MYRKTQLFIVFLLLFNFMVPNLLGQTAPRPVPPPTGPVSSDPPPLDPDEEIKDEDKPWQATNLDIRHFIRVFATKLKMNISIDSSVNGHVSCQIYGKLTDEQYRKVFTSILQQSGIRIQLIDNIYHFSRMQGREFDRMIVKSKEEIENTPTSEVPVIAVISMDYMTSMDANKFIVPLLSRGGTVLATNLDTLLLVVDYPSNIQSIIRVIELVDVKYERKFFDIVNLDADEIVQQLDKLYFNEKAKKLINFVPLQRQGKIVVLSTSPKLLDQASKDIAELDVEPNNTGRQIFVYQVKFKLAEEIVDVLNNFYGQISTINTTGGTTGRRNPNAPTRRPTTTPADRSGFQGGRNINTRQNRAETAPAPAPAPPAAGSNDKITKSTGEFEDEIMLQADAATNKILVYATNADYKIIKAAIDQLDVKLRQVLVEVTIAEVILSDGLEMGIEWAGRSMDGNRYQGGESNSGYGLPLDGSAFSTRSALSGLNYLIGKSDKFVAYLNALEEKSLISILSSPHILTLDNQEAVVEIVEEIPITSRSTTEFGQTESTEYKSAGIKLTVLPQINDDRLVTLELTLESSNQADSVGDQLSFFSRGFETKVYMEDQQTLFIGGLIKRTKSKSRKGVPLLSRIPVLGWLFRKTNKTDVSTELVVVITPHVIDNREQADPITKAIREERMWHINNLIKEVEEERAKEKEAYDKKQQRKKDRNNRKNKRNRKNNINENVRNKNDFSKSR